MCEECNYYGPIDKMCEECAFKKQADPYIIRLTLHNNKQVDVRFHKVKSVFHYIDRERNIYDKTRCIGKMNDRNVYIHLFKYIDPCPKKEDMFSRKRSSMTEVDSVYIWEKTHGFKYAEFHKEPVSRFKLY